MDNKIKPDNTHSGHRLRVKESVKENGFGHLSDERLLELILFYSIPRKETYDIAKVLVREFGSLQNVFFASYESLCKVHGLGENTALMIVSMGETFRRMSVPKVDGRVSLKTVDDMKCLVKGELLGLNNENVILICLDGAKRVKKVVRISEGDKRESFLDVKKCVQAVIDCEATTAFIAHNHPENSCQPSAEDIDSTRALCVMFRKLGVHLIDHIIVDYYGDAYSMRSDPILSLIHI